MAGDPIRLQPCRLQDLDAVLALWREAGAVPRQTDHRAALELRLRRDPELFVLAWAGDRLAGTLLGGWDGWRGNMYRLAVHPDYRRRGIAALLVRRVEVELRRLGAERITSLVFTAEPGAAQFWARAGYASDRSTQRFAKDLVQGA